MEKHSILNVCVYEWEVICTPVIHSGISTIGSTHVQTSNSLGGIGVVLSWRLPGGTQAVISNVSSRGTERYHYWNYSIHLRKSRRSARSGPGGSLAHAEMRWPRGWQGKPARHRQGAVRPDQGTMRPPPRRRNSSSQPTTRRLRNFNLAEALSQHRQPPRQPHHPPRGRLPDFHRSSATRLSSTSTTTAAS